MRTSQSEAQVVEGCYLTNGDEIASSTYIRCRHSWWELCIREFIAIGLYSY